MSDDHQPEAVWVFPETKTDKGRVWLIVILAIVAVAIVGALFVFLMPRDGGVEPMPSPTTSTTVSPTSAATPTEVQTPEPTQPNVPAPDLETFSEQVQPRLDDAVRGLQLISDNVDLGDQIVDSLQQDAAVLSDTAAPTSIASDWTSLVSQYATNLNELRETYNNDADNRQSAIDAAEAALQKVRATVGL